jgi:phosphoribosylglycinamide formyltransferase-1
MQALVEARLPMEIRAVMSNRPEAGGLQWAAARGIETRVVDHKSYPSREAFDRALGDAIDAYSPDVILLAGFMRVLTEGFVRRFPRKMLNIHPSLLPAFAGLHTHERALAAGVKVHGATVHVVTPALDNGPIVIQGVVPVIDGDTAASLAERVLAIEHRIYPQAVRWFVEGRIEFLPTGVVQVKDSGVSSDCIVSPRDPQ